MSEYITVSLHDAFGNTLHEFHGINYIKYQRGANRVGELQIYFPIQYAKELNVVSSYYWHKPLEWGRHYQLRIWRSITNRNGVGYTTPVLEPSTVWIITRPGKIVRRSGEMFIKITASDWLWALTTRYIAYHSEHARHSKNEAADDAIRKWFTEQFLGDSDNPADRDVITSGVLSVSSLSAALPVISQEASYESLLTTIQDACERCLRKGTWIAVDFFSTLGNFPWMLDIKSKQLGSDRTIGNTVGNREVVFSVLNGTIVEVEYGPNYADEYTAVFGLGPGTGSDRLISVVTDPVRIGTSPFGRIESIEQARMAKTQAEVADAANGKLGLGDPRRYLVLTIEDTFTYRYGDAYFYGDRVTIDLEGDSVGVPARIVGVDRELTDGKVVQKFAFEDASLN